MDEPKTIRQTKFTKMPPHAYELNRMIKIVTVVIACAITTAALSGYVLWDARTAASEAYKASLQVIVVVILGTGVKLLGDLYHSRRSQEAALRELQRRSLTDLLSAYNKVKHARRLMRARGFARKPLLNSIAIRDFYDAQMAILSQSELEIEHVWKHAKAGAGPFSARLNGEIRRYVGTMTDYLDGIIDEYQATMPSIWDLDAGKPWPEMDAMADFLATKDSRFYTDFADTFAQLRDTLRTDLLHDVDASPTWSVPGLASSIGKPVPQR
jgi:hypothetical protein